MLVHVHVHRGRERDRASCREQDGRDERVRDAGGGLGDEVGGRRRDDDRVGGVGEPYMADFGFVREIESVD